MRHRFTMSSTLFSGFTKTFETDNIESIEHVITVMVEELKNIFRSQGLIILLEELNKLHFHYHDYSLLDVITSTDTNKVWYICECT